MNYSKFSLISSLIILMAVISEAFAEESTRDRIQKHKEWLNRRIAEKQRIGDAPSDDVNEKIKYFKKLIKFKNSDDPHGNEISFVPHLSDNRLIENESTTVIIDTGSKFAYDTINNNDEVDTNPKNTLNDTRSLTKSSNEIIGEQQQLEVNKQTINEETSSQAAIVDEIVTTNANIEIENISNVNQSNTTKTTISSSRNRIVTKTDSKNKISAGQVASTSNDVEIRKFITEHMNWKQNNVTVKKSWGKWGKWSDCSRSCGDGVMSQSRECTEKMYKNGKRINITTISLNECIGFYRRFRICNEMDCPNSDLDFRAQQCSEFNNQSFRGQVYEWEPYVKDDAECELNCRPVNQKYFARLREYAVDGTTCYKIHNPPKGSNISSERAVCVEGKCKAVLNSGTTISGSGFMNSGNVRCGSTVCRPISGIFTKGGEGSNPLPNGYVHVTTIPAGASNITITEMRNSINFLALKSTDSEYIINGNYTVSPSGSYDVAGSTFEYHRFDGSLKVPHHQKRSDGVTEWITSAGPLFEPVHLMVLSQQTNPGIKYEYLLPTTLATSDESEVDYVSSAEENLPLNYKLKAANSQANTTSVTGRRKRKFQWKVVGFTPCSKTCGGGTQQPIVRCVRGELTKSYSPKKCSHLAKPVLNESLMKCNSQPCPAFWKLGEWAGCRCGEFDEKTNQTREVKCVQELISGVVIQVNSGACNEGRPVAMLPCECMKPTKAPKLEVYKYSRQPILQSTQNDQKVHGGKNRGNRRNELPKNKKSGSWLVSEWSDQCSSECGVGQQFRTVFCDRNPPNTERCDVRLTPNTFRECTSNARCKGEWFIGPWSLCSGDCFNASRSRTVLCIKNDGFAEESECDVEVKPSTFEDCQSSDMNDCKPKWHFSEWTECNKPCGGGTQRRTIKCLELQTKENILRDSSKCKYSERPPGLRHCNVQACTETTTSYDPRVDMIQNDDPNCRDEFPNCSMVLKSKLCGYAYYNENCCQSCRMISNELF